MKKLIKKKKFLILILLILVVLVVFLVIRNQFSGYSSAEKLLEEFVDAINNDNMDNFIEKSLDSRIYLAYYLYNMGDIFPFYDNETDTQIKFESFYNDLCLVLEEDYKKLIKKYSEYGYSEEDFEECYEEAYKILENLENSEKSDEEELYEYLEKYYELADIKLEIEDIEFVEYSGIYEKYSYKLCVSGTYNDIELEDEYTFTTSLLQINGNYYMLKVNNLIELLSLIIENLDNSSEEVLSSENSLLEDNIENEEQTSIEGNDKTESSGYTINGMTKEEWEEQEESIDEYVYEYIMQRFEMGLTEDLTIDLDEVKASENATDSYDADEQAEVEAEIQAAIEAYYNGESN